ncbi:hypothetical protein GCM10027341_03630 [Spirosoma knui]
MGNMVRSLPQIPSLATEYIDCLVTETVIHTAIPDWYGANMFKQSTEDQLFDTYRDRYLYYEEFWRQHLADYNPEEILLNSWYWYRVLNKYAEDKAGKELGDWREVEMKYFLDYLSWNEDNIPLFRDIILKTRSVYEVWGEWIDSYGFT